MKIRLVQSTSDLSFWQNSGITIPGGQEVSDPRVVFDPAGQPVDALRQAFDPIAAEYAMHWTLRAAATSCARAVPASLGPTSSS